MASEFIERLRYYERQYLGVGDFVAEQTYLRDHDRRHNLSPHTWGLIAGLDLIEQDKEAGEPGVDIYISPGIAVDGYGREIVLLEPYPVDEELFASYVFNPAAPDGVWIPLWIGYREETTDLPRPGYEQCDIDNQAARIRETFRLFTGFLTPSQIRDKVTVAGSLVSAADEIPDASIPYQSLSDTDKTRWLIRLGNVRWLAKPAPNQPGNYFVKSETADEKKKAREERPYAGNVTAAVLAPAAELRIADRMTGTLPSDTNDEHYMGVAVGVEGSLRVDRLLVAKQDAQLHGGKLDFRNIAGDDETIPLWMQRLKSADGKTTDLRIHLGDTPAATTRLTIGPKSGSDEMVVMDVRADNIVDIPTGALDFGRRLGQMIHLWTSALGDREYGIGIQSSTLYQRSHSDFCWFRGGVHSDTQSDPGGGTLQLRLDAQGRLHFGSETKQMLNLWESGGILYYGIGIQSSTEYFRSAADFCWFRGGAHSDTRGDAGIGGTLAMKLDNLSNLTVAGGVTTGGDVLVGTNTDRLVKTRRINGKHWANDTDHDLLLNWNTGTDVYVGDPNGTPSDLRVSGELRVKGASNVFKVSTFALRIKNSSSNTPGGWTQGYAGFAEVYQVIATLNGYSLWDNTGDASFMTHGHVQSDGAIPQHVVVRVDGFTNTSAHGIAYCSESDVALESDNTVFFTLTVFGRGTF